NAVAQPGYELLDVALAPLERDQSKRGVPIVANEQRVTVRIEGLHLAHALDARQAIRGLRDLILETRIVDRLRRGAEDGHGTGKRRRVEFLIQDRGGPGRLRVGIDEATALDRLGRLRR